MTEPKVKHIDVQELKRRQEAKPDLCLIDVREDYEWQAARIPGAIHLPKDEIPILIRSQIPELDKPIYLHCHAGVRSLYAAEYLLHLGYKDVYSVDGGIDAWGSAGFPVLG
jgi:rhodanese-related sulfurtransferase